MKLGARSSLPQKRPTSLFVSAYYPPSSGAVCTENLIPGDETVGLRYSNADGRVSDQAAPRRAMTRETLSRKHCPTSAGDCNEPQGSVAGAAPEHRSPDFRLALPNVPSILNAITMVKPYRDPVAFGGGFAPIGTANPAELVAVIRSTARSATSSDGFRGRRSRFSADPEDRPHRRDSSPCRAAIINTSGFRF
jgi:hypothetical protein